MRTIKVIISNEEPVTSPSYEEQVKYYEVDDSNFSEFLKDTRIGEKAGYTDIELEYYILWHRNYRVGEVYLKEVG